MNKTEAIEKIKKILALANDKAAAPGERENALELAQKLANKYGLKIEKGTSNSKSTSTYKRNENPYSFYPKYAYSKIIRAMYAVIVAAGFKAVIIREGRKLVGIGYFFSCDINSELDKIYKEICKSCDNYKKTKKEEGTWLSGAELTDNWSDIMVYAAKGCENTYKDSSTFTTVFNFSTSMVKKMTDMKEGH